MDSIAIVRKDGDHREQKSAQTTAEARRVLDQWDEQTRPVLQSRSAGRKGGLRIQKTAKR